MKQNRKAPIEIRKEEFRQAGYQLIDRIAEFFSTIDSVPVTRGESSAEVQKILGDVSLPDEGSSMETLLEQTTEMLLDHSLFNGHPRFLGYITSSAAPIGVLGDLLAAAVNPNVGAQILSPIATGIEKQTVKWLSEFIGVSTDYGGLLVSGGNMANFTGFLAARTAKASGKVKDKGMAGQSPQLRLYCSKTTHTWVEKAAILFGLGTEAIRWIATNEAHQMDLKVLEKVIETDIAEGYQPFMVVGTAGDVSTGVVDDLAGMGVICQKYDLWFHIDGAYGVPAAVVPEHTALFAGMEQADSIALDPHKWLYSPLEAGCVLVKDPQHLLDTFSSKPVYYNFNQDAETRNYYEFGLQNSRGFRALKVWLALRQVGREGYIEMIRKDIELSKLFYDLADAHPELEAVTQNLSIATLRYIPNDIGEKDKENYLNHLNESLVNHLQKGGKLFLSNAIINGKYCLRGCIVNFRTSRQDIEEMIEIIVREGRRLHGEMG